MKSLYSTAQSVGDIITETLSSKSLKQSELCDITGIAKPILNDVIKGRRNITAEMAILIESVLGISADKLLQIQISNDLEKAYKDEKVIKRLKDMSDWAILSKKVSLPILKKLCPSDNSIHDKLIKTLDFFQVSSIEDFLELSDKEERQSYFKKSDKLHVDTTALFTWKHYCINQSSKTKINNPFDKNRIDELCHKIIEITTENRDTYDRVQRVFLDYGVRLLYIPKEGQVPVDGLSFWIGDNPTVIITKRLTNIDNFAFSVMHEIGHIKLHLLNNSETFININSEDIDKQEEEANLFAKDVFISPTIWNNFMNKVQTYNPYSVHLAVKELADKLNINPQILYGRYMYETGLYRLRRVFPTEVM